MGAMEARRLVRTESTYIANSAELESYRACGMEKFRFCAVLDIRTSDICAAMDGRVFEVAKAAIGENVPPLHPWCRSTTVAHFEKTDLSRLERSARDPVTGKHSRIPGDMTYEEWKKQVDETHGGGTWETERKKVLNRAADRRQYDKYREALGKKNLPKTLDGFQQLKYNKSKEWDELKRRYRYENQPYLQKQLVYKLPNGEAAFIPGQSIISASRTIAGAGSKVKLRVEPRLIEAYGGQQGEWKKRVGKIESEQYVFDVHWYELAGVQYESKVKHRSDK